MTESI